MTHLLDTSALLAHFLAEQGATRVQALFEDPAVIPGTSVLALFEFELRLDQLGVDSSSRSLTLTRYRALLGEIANVDEAVRLEGIRIRSQTTPRVSAMDTLIAATASVRGAVLVHRDPHYIPIPTNILKQEMLPAK